MTSGAISWRRVLRAPVRRFQNRAAPGTSPIAWSLPNGATATGGGPDPANVPVTAPFSAVRMRGGPPVLATRVRPSGVTRSPNAADPRFLCHRAVSAGAPVGSKLPAGATVTAGVTIGVGSVMGCGGSSCVPAGGTAGPDPPLTFAAGVCALGGGFGFSLGATAGGGSLCSSPGAWAVSSGFFFPPSSSAPPTAAPIARTTAPAISSKPAPPRAAAGGFAARFFAAGRRSDAGTGLASSVMFSHSVAAGTASATATGGASPRASAASRSAAGVSGTGSPSGATWSSHGVRGIGLRQATARCPTSARSFGSPASHSSRSSADPDGFRKSASVNSRLSPVSWRSHRAAPRAISPRIAVAITRRGNRSRSGE